jgi:phosphate ABC transporter phosphate-binding protein
MVTAGAVLTVVSAGLLASAPPASAASFTTISGAGSTFAQNAINTWVADVASNGLTVNYSAVGSTAGLNAFKAGSVNFAASEIPYGAPDASGSNPPPTRGFAYMPDVAGGLAFMYNLVINGQRVTNLRLSGAVIAGIFTGQIAVWDDPKIAADNPGIALPATSVIPVVRADGDGANYQFTQWMMATQGSAWTAYCQVIGITPCTATSAYPVDPADPSMVGQNGDAGVSGYIAQASSNGAIGFVAYSYAIRAGFPVAKVLNAAGYYTLPTAGNIGVSLGNAQFNSDGTANLAQVYTDTDPRTYELSYYSYLVIPTDTSAAFPLSANAGYSLGAFGTFLLCQGQQQVDNLGYSALPINLVESGYTQLQKIPGAQIPATSAAFIQGCNNPTFSPDGTNKLATSDPMPQACDQQGPTQCSATSVVPATTTSVSISPNPPVAGQSALLTATVTAPASVTPPAGSVQFRVGLTLLGNPVAVNSSGVATTTATFTTAGTQAVSASFLPTDVTAFSGSSGSLTVTVVALPSAPEVLTVTNPPSGTFTFTASTTSTITMAVSGNTATGAMNPVTIDETRNTFPGWSVIGQSSDFTNPTSTPPGDIPGNQLGWAPNDTALAPGAVLGPVVPPAAPGLGTFAATLADAVPGTGFGTSTLGANLTFAIPPLVPSGAYTGVLTLTADPAGP